MSKKYFTKYLPIGGEIKDGDLICWWIGEKHGEVVKANGDGKRAEKFKKVKLFLCTRDVEVGDSIYSEDGTQYKKVEYGEDNAGTPYWACDSHDVGSSVAPCVYIIPKKEAYKVIGEVSPGAVWVKEGDEFDEYEEWWYSIKNSQPFVLKLDEAWDERLAERKEEFKIVLKLICPTCKTFH